MLPLHKGSFDNFIMWFFITLCEIYDLLIQIKKNNKIQNKKKDQSLFHEVLFRVIILLVCTFCELTMFPLSNVEKFKVFFFLSDPNLVKFMVLVTSLHEWSCSWKLKFFLHDVVKNVNEGVITQFVWYFLVSKCKVSKPFRE